MVIATGTALGGRIFVGEAHYDGGPDGTHAATALTKDLTAHGVPLRRFKTGTPARAHRRSIDFSKLDCQPGDPDELLQPFSFMTHKPMHNKVDCYIAYTNPETHRSSWTIWTARRCTAGTFRVSARGTALRLKIRWCALRARNATRCLWSPAARTPRRCTCRG